MTVPATARRAGPYNGNGSTTSFSFSFKTYAAGDLLVTKMDALGLETTLVLNSDYSVTLNGDQDASPGGSITYPISGSALPSGHKLTIIGDLDYQQTTDLLGGGAFNARVIEDTFDRATIQIQQLEERLDRALLIPVNSTANVQLPDPEGDKVIGWDEDGTKLVNYSPSDLATVVVTGTSYTDVFSGTGAQTVFVLTANPGSVNAVDIAIGGVSQVNGVDFTVSGTTLTFTSAPPAGTGNICVRYVAAVPVGSANSQDVSFLQAGTGAVTRTAQAKLRETVSVKDFGAVGDGVVNDTAAIQDALNHAATVSAVVYAPAGEYLMGATVVVPSNVMLYGDGFGTKFVRDTSVAAFDFFELKSVAHVQLLNFLIDGVAKLDNAVQANRYCGIRVWADGGSRSNDIEIVGVHIDKTTSAENQTEGNRSAILLEDCYDVRVSRCKFYDNRATAILVTIKNGTTGYNTNNIQIEQCYGIGERAPYLPAFPSGFGSFISGNYHTDVMVSGCYVDGFGFSNISMNGPRSTVQNCISKNSNYVGINLGHSTTGDNCDDSVVDGNITTNNTFSGITVVASKNVIVSNNTSYDDGNAAGWPGLRVLHDGNYDPGETINVTIIGNQLLNCSQGGVAIEAGTHVQFTGNLVANSGSTALFIREKEPTETLWAFVSNNVFIDNGGTQNSAIEVNTSAAGGYGATNVVAKDNFIFSSDIATKQRWGITSVGDGTSVMQVNNNWFSSNYNGTAVNTTVAVNGYALNKFGTSSLANANIVNA